MSHGLLFKCASDDELEEPQLCVPREMRPEVLRDCHGSECSGHFGTRRTVARFAQKFYWPGMMKDVSDYVRLCATCKRLANELQTTF